VSACYSELLEELEKLVFRLCTLYGCSGLLQSNTTRQGSLAVPDVLCTGHLGHGRGAHEASNSGGERADKATSWGWAGYRSIVGHVVTRVSNSRSVRFLR